MVVSIMGPQNRLASVGAEAYDARVLAYMSHELAHLTLCEIMRFLLQSRNCGHEFEWVIKPIQSPHPKPAVLNGLKCSERVQVAK